MDSEDDDVPQLTSETFAALQEFYKEQEIREKRMLHVNNTEIDTNLGEDIIIDEDWQLSQFWYSQNTIETLTDLALKIAPKNGKIALVSCPTLYKKLKLKAKDNLEVTLFEFDKRFSVYGKDFILYDYKSPLDIPRNKSSYYDLIIADPPFLSEECLTKTAVTLKFLAKDKIVLCTGAIMSDLAKRLLDLEKTSFTPEHKNNLANEFWCYSNFDLDKYL